VNHEHISVRSPRVAAARRLAKRSFRAAQRQFLAEGPQSVREAVAQPGVLRELFVTADAAARPPEIVTAAQDTGALVRRVDRQVLASICQTTTPQDLIGVCRFVDVALDDVVTRTPMLVAVLAGVRDPGNAGTVLRTTDAAGADAVVVTSSSVDVYNGKSVRASAGSLFHVPVVLGVSIEEAVMTLREAGLRILAADSSGPSDLDGESDAGVLARPTAWIFGNEAWGLPDPILGLADTVVRVPIYGQAESLNLAAAAAVCLYASARAQHR